MSTSDEVVPLKEEWNPSPAERRQWDKLANRQYPLQVGRERFETSNGKKYRDGSISHSF
jgi:hypothetical protein